MTATGVLNTPISTSRASHSTRPVHGSRRAQNGLSRTLHEKHLYRRLDQPQPDYQRWLAHTSSAAGCVRPVRLTGHLHTVDQTTGAILATRHTRELPDGVVYVPCGDRRVSVCPPCAETYRADTYQLIKAGLVGGKGIPTTVQDHPAVFATLTAPSFGPVHTHTLNPRTGTVRPCHIRRGIQLCPHGRLLACARRHPENDPHLGRPLCPDCYDYDHHVVWNAWASELWRRTTITLHRLLRPLEHIHGTKLRVSFGKVAEYQRRGVVHFHALLRLDMIDPNDPDAVVAPPSGIHAEPLVELVTEAVTTTGFQTPTHPDTRHSWSIHWGAQLDIRPVTGIHTGAITAEAVAGYLAKYATKATESTGLKITARLTTESAHHHTTRTTHLDRLITTAWTLGATPHTIHHAHRQWLAHHDPNDEHSPLQEWKTGYGRLRRWAHMLGFGGHFATKSRHYSTTHKAIRAQRRAWRITRRYGTRKRWDSRDCDDTTTILVTDLSLAGIGYHTTADAQLATAAAARAREQRQTAKQERKLA